MNISSTNSLDNTDFLSAISETSDIFSGSQLLDGEFNARQAPIRIEAEDLDLTGYQVETYDDVDFFSGDSLISLKRSDGISGQAAGTFEGPEGVYDIKIGYYDEDDGQATLSVTVNGNEQSFYLTEDLNGNRATAQIITDRVTHQAIELQEGDSFSLEGIAHRGEFARIDYIEFVPIDDSDPADPTPSDDIEPPTDEDSEPEADPLPTPVPDDTPAPEPEPTIIDGVEIGDSHFYLDLDNGDDSNSGDSRANAWKSFERVNQAASSGEISTGTDLIIYGNSKDQQAIIDWNGTPDDPVLIATDTSSDRATLVADANTASSIFHITGSNIEVHNVVVRGEPTGYSEPIDYFDLGFGPDRNQAATGYIRGFALEDAQNVILDGVEASGTYSGVYIDSKSESNKVIDSHIHHNNIISIQPGDDDDSGGIAILIHGNNNEIANNRFEHNLAGSPDYVMDGAAIELFNGSNNSIHHNSSRQDRVFAELGRAANSPQTMTGNSFTFNTSYSNYNNIAETIDGIWTEYREGGRFVVTRGEGNFGPVYDTTVTDNTVTMDGSGSDFIACIQCGEDILTYGRNKVQTTRHRVWWDGAEPMKVN